MNDEGFIPYLVLVRLDKGEDLRDRLHESLSLLQESLKELGELEPAISSYDGSVVAYLLSTHPSIQPQDVLAQLQSPKSRRASPLKTHDKVLIVSIELGLASRLERVSEWLLDRGSLA